MKRLIFVLAFVAASCVPPVPQQPRTVTVTVTDGSRPILGAVVLLDASDPLGTHTAGTDTQGVATLPLVPPLWRNVQMTITAAGCRPLGASTVLGVGNVVLHEQLACLPPLPTRDEILNVHLSFQGLTVHTQQFGDLPWFEAALPWLNAEDRQAAYAEKRASQAWEGGDTHALIQLPSGNPLYDEPHQPYSADRFGPLDWTNGNTKIDGRLADLIVEVARAGFSKQLLFEGGDDGERGFPIAMVQLDLLHDALLHSAYGDLRGYVVPLPGYDGVFYGYSRQHIYDWIAKCRSLFPYCGLEHSTGHIPAGEGPGEWWAPNGPMRGLDLLLSEFDDDRFDGSVWEIAARMIGPSYRRPSNQPAGDDPHPPFYLRDATERGPIVNCAFEFGEFGFVHGQYGADHVVGQREYFKRIGYSCGG